MSISKNDLKKFSSLKRKTKRKELGAFVVEGVKNCKELIKSRLQILTLLITEENLLSDFPNGIIISENDASRITQLKSHSSVIAIAKIPENRISTKLDKPILFLENIKDPGNLGTIIRTLDWFGYSQLFCSLNCVDAFNSKTVMASMGSVFRLNINYLNFLELIEKFPNYIVYGTFLEGESIYKSNIGNKSIIVMGNESFGISKEIESIISKKIYIPGKGKAESLNVSTASAIILSEINKSEI